MFENANDVPGDLARVVRSLRRNLHPDDFRGITGQDLQRWLPRVGRKRRVPTHLKSFRFTTEDLRLLDHISERLAISETEVIRRGLRALAASHLQR